jgi:hypothetical protein
MIDFNVNPDVPMIYRVLKANFVKDYDAVRLVLISPYVQMKARFAKRMDIVVFLVDVRAVENVKSPLLTVI